MPNTCIATGRAASKAQVPPAFGTQLNAAVHAAAISGWAAAAVGQHMVGASAKPVLPILQLPYCNNEVYVYLWGTLIYSVSPWYPHLKLLLMCVQQIANPLNLPLTSLQHHLPQARSTHASATDRLPGSTIWSLPIAQPLCCVSYRLAAYTARAVLPFAQQHPSTAYINLG